MTTDEKVIRRAVLKERQRCVAIAKKRELACKKSADFYLKQIGAEIYWHASERCAQREAAYIARLIREGKDA